MERNQDTHNSDACEDTSSDSGQEDADQEILQPRWAFKRRQLARVHGSCSVQSNWPCSDNEAGCAELLWSIPLVDLPCVAMTSTMDAFACKWRILLQRSMFPEHRPSRHVKIEMLAPYGDAVPAVEAMLLLDEVPYGARQITFYPAHPSQPYCTRCFRFSVREERLRGEDVSRDNLLLQVNLVLQAWKPLNGSLPLGDIDAGTRLSEAGDASGTTCCAKPIQAEVEEIPGVVVGTLWFHHRFGWRVGVDEHPCASFWRSLLEKPRKLKFSVGDLLRSKIKPRSFSTDYMDLVRRFFIEAPHLTNEYGFAFVPYELILHGTDVEDMTANSDEAGRTAPSHQLVFDFLDWIRDVALEACERRAARRDLDSSSEIELPEGPPGSICAVCHATATLTCSSCKSIAYCTRACFKKHWKVGQPVPWMDHKFVPHKEVCPDMKVLMDAGADNLFALGLPTVRCRIHHCCSHCGIHLLSLKTKPFLCEDCRVSIYCSQRCMMLDRVKFHDTDCKPLKHMCGLVLGTVALHLKLATLFPNKCYCGAKAPKRCSQCHTRYCSSACQRSDWPSHKQTCAGLRKRHRRMVSQMERKQAEIANLWESRNFKDKNLETLMCSLRTPDSIVQTSFGLPASVEAFVVRMPLQRACTVLGVDVQVAECWNLRVGRGRDFYF